VPSLTSTSNAQGNGQANLDLRGLGAARTLVLVNGTRMIGATGDGVPDLNVIPPALIESVEIITGGASAVYGSDAIGGVVNLKLKEFDGVEVSGRQQTDRDDGVTISLTAARIRRRSRLGHQVLGWPVMGIDRCAGFAGGACVQGLS
jgi:outer membrane receptor for ferrienterochelin and colicin